MNSAPRLRGLYAITDEQSANGPNLLAHVERAIAGGARVIQYRNKTGRDARKRATNLQRLCERYAVPLIINDDSQLAADVGAHGVHLGRDDCSVAQARALLGEHALVGVSCYDVLSRALVAQEDGADYVAFGSFFPSSTKPDAVRAPIDLLRQAKATLAIPVVAIGGITVDNGAALVAAGADCLAVIEGVFGQPDITGAAAGYARLFTEA